MIKNKFQKFLNNQSGNMAFMFGLFTIPLFLGIGAAIDLAAMVQARAALQAAADSAALAGAARPKLPQAELEKIVADYANQNGASEVMKNVTSIKPLYNESTGVFQVAIDGYARTTIMQLAGIKTLKIKAVAQVALGTRAMDVAMVLDTTGSMGSPMSKMDSLKSAANLFIDIVTAEKADYSDLRVSVVPFAEYVNVGGAAPSATEPDTSGGGLLGGLLGGVLGGSPPTAGCVGTRSAANRTTVYGTGEKYKIISGPTCANEITPLTNDMTKVKSEIAGLTPQGATFIPAGILWGWQTLTPDAPYSEGMTNQQMSDLQGHKVLILMTDGANTKSPGAGAKHDGTDTTVANDMTAQLCANAKADKIGIYTVSFMVTDPTIQGILDNCASETSNSYNADNSAQLTEAFRDIGTKLSQMRLTQ